MTRTRPYQLAWTVTLSLWLWTPGVQAQRPQYRYVDFSDIPLPTGITSFLPAAIQDSGRVYGSACGGSGPCNMAFYAHGVMTVFPVAGSFLTVNASGTVGGFVEVNPDPENLLVRAALFRGGEMKIVPPQLGEVFAQVLALNDRGTALVSSTDASGHESFVLYSDGVATPLDFGPLVTNPTFNSAEGGGRFINDEGIIVGTTGDAFGSARGFRFDSRTGETTLLAPAPSETLAWGLGINNRGDVLGLSFILGEPHHESYGVWDHKGNFKPYISTGTIGSFLLTFNDNNTIVATRTTTNDSYVATKPGVYFNLADLTIDLPSETKLKTISGINNHGDMIGRDAQGGYFLLERVGG